MRFYLRMAWRSLRRSRGLTAVMILALSLGIATWYAQQQIFMYLDSRMPVAREHVYQVALERGEAVPDGRASLVVPLLPSILLTPRDAQGVLAGAASHRHTMTFGAPALIEPEGKPAETVRVRYATRDLFELFSIPLREGEPWSAAADAGWLAGTPVDVAVVDERLARRLFGAGSALGRRLRVDGADVRIVGVVAASHREHYHLYERFVPTLDAVYLPLAHARAAHAEADFQHVVASGEAGSVGVWVQLPTESARLAFTASAAEYLTRERAAGRTAAPRAVTLRTARQWQAAFAPGGTINLWPLLSAMCLVTCVLNLVRMLMAKFAGRSHDLGLLRAFGARRRGVMGQLLLEAVLIGLCAGACGMLLGVALMPLATQTLQDAAGSVPLISARAVLATVGASVGAALLAALYPAWRLSRGTPAAQLRRD
ncbi:MAG TPA: FtsX-like permease family protein [Kofleriaceae bacterium]